ncbi:hypothetical protein CEXT_46051 [Caerostris extrusa]|uniref:Uncharacterized protein n=1 Tax=Caerostris extrusa TaxID=172846 RepID=A0AAV4XBR6_CAEEX|nr:hypothetical protein CEXT_46051 [Caerostris extrusa]
MRIGGKEKVIPPCVVETYLLLLDRLLTCAHLPIVVTRQVILLLSKAGIRVLKSIALSDEERIRKSSLQTSKRMQFVSSSVIHHSRAVLPFTARSIARTARDVLRPCHTRDRPAGDGHVGFPAATRRTPAGPRGVHRGGGTRHRRESCSCETASSSSSCCSCDHPPSSSSSSCSSRVYTPDSSSASSVPDPDLSLPYPGFRPVTLFFFTQTSHPGTGASGW